MRTVVVVHTGPASVQPIKQQFEQILPDVRVVNIMDDSLLNDVMAAGRLTEAVTGRIFSYMQLGQQMGAVAAGPRVGVVATVRTTLEPTVRLIKAKAAAAGRSIEVTEALAEGGFQALLDGNPELHDDIVKRTIQSLADQVDVIVLAQVSMARLIPSLTGMKVPVLSSLQSGVETVRGVLANLH